jgi:hypothetical protein
VTATYAGSGDLSWLLDHQTLSTYGVKPRAVLHIGAHRAEELPIYYALMFNRVYLVEPDTNDMIEAAALDVERVSVRTFAVANVPGPTHLPWARCTNTMQSGLSSVRTDPPVYAVPLSYVQETCTGANVLVVDTSGTELDVLMSGDLSVYDMVIVETDTTGVHASPHGDVVTYMAREGFVDVERWTHGPHTYADVVFVRD